MSVPGIVAQHVIITGHCRENRGDDGAFDEAVERLRVVYDRVASGWATGSGLKMHLVLTVERPDSEEPAP